MDETFISCVFRCIKQGNGRRGKNKKKLASTTHIRLSLALATHARARHVHIGTIGVDKGSKPSEHLHSEGKQEEIAATGTSAIIATLAPATRSAAQELGFPRQC